MVCRGSHNEPHLSMMVNEADGEKQRFVGRYNGEPPIPREISRIGGCCNCLLDIGAAGRDGSVRQLT